MMAGTDQRTAFTGGYKGGIIYWFLLAALIGMILMEMRKMIMVYT
jgi:hypothetical protein